MSLKKKKKSKELQSCRHGSFASHPSSSASNLPSPSNRRQPPPPARPMLYHVTAPASPRPHHPIRSPHRNQPPHLILRAPCIGQHRLRTSPLRSDPQPDLLRVQLHNQRLREQEHEYRRHRLLFPCLGARSCSG